MSATFSHICSHCGERDIIDRAITVHCPTCAARPDSPCLDMRGKNPGVRPIAKMHPARQNLVREMDTNRYAIVRQLTSVSTG